MPPKWGYGESGEPRAGIKGTDTLVFVIDLIDSFNSKSSAKGKPVAQKVAQGEHALPTVDTNTDGKLPKVTVDKKAAPPRKLTSVYVLEATARRSRPTRRCCASSSAWSGRAARPTGRRTAPGG